MNQVSLNRLDLRFNFVVNNKALFDRYARIDGYAQSSNPIVKDIANKARNAIAYSDKTVDCDIAYSLANFYRSIKNIIVI